MRFVRQDSLVTWSPAVGSVCHYPCRDGGRGRFAPGHLGELTQQVPFEMVDAVLEQTCRVQRRVRVLPARVVVYLLLAGCLFAELGYAQVWHRLTAGLDGLPVRGPDRVRDDPGAPASGSRAAARAVRPAARPGPRRGARWRGLLVCAIDGTIMTVAVQRG